ncbi:flavodoxin family protein [Chloroflexota bacterium]
MNVLAIVGSPRKGKATDLLVDRAIEGVKSKDPNCDTKKLNLIDYDIQHCRNCLACRDIKSNEPYTRCAIKDDMVGIYEDVFNSDALIFGTPVHMGYATALTMSFLERICWTFAKPEKSYLNVHGCPLPRSDKKRKSITIVTSGTIPPLYRRLCDQAAPLIRGVIKDSLNAKTVGDLYAGDIEHRGVDRYLGKSFKLGKKLA